MERKDHTDFVVIVVVVVVPFGVSVPSSSPVPVFSNEKGFSSLDLKDSIHSLDIKGASAPVKSRISSHGSLTTT